MWQPQSKWAHLRGEAQGGGSGNVPQKLIAPAETWSSSLTPDLAISRPNSAASALPTTRLQGSLTAPTNRTTAWTRVKACGYLCGHNRRNAAAGLGKLCVKELVGARGFEPPTPCAQGRCATRLRYAPTRTTYVDSKASSNGTSIPNAVFDLFSGSNCTKTVPKPFGATPPVPKPTLIHSRDDVASGGLRASSEVSSGNTS